jgi:hypothetical protein
LPVARSPLEDKERQPRAAAWAVSCTLLERLGSCFLAEANHSLSLEVPWDGMRKCELPQRFTHWTELRGAYIPLPIDATLRRHEIPAQMKIGKRKTCGGIGTNFPT